MRSLFLSGLLISFHLSFSQDQHRNSAAKNQTNMQAKWFGFKVGYNKSRVRGYDSNGNKTGFIGDELYGGFFIDAHLNNKINLGGEALFSWTDEYHFIEVPLHLRYKLTTKWNVFAGPKFDYILETANSFAGIGYQFKNFGVSGELGMQYNITNSFFAETRYARSFTEQVTDFLLDINKGKRNTFRIGLGIKF